MNTPTPFTTADGREMLRYPDNSVRPVDESRLKGLRRVAAEQVELKVVRVYEPKPLSKRQAQTRKGLAIQMERVAAMTQGREVGTFDHAFIGYRTALNRYGTPVDEVVQPVTGQKAAA